jgi:tetratricopeptide (TPR) repeat protein
MTEIVEGGGQLDSFISAANDLKNEGNVFLAAHKYSLAAEKYTSAIELYPSSILYSNRAQALIKLESYGLAIQDANESIRYTAFSRICQISDPIVIGEFKILHTSLLSYLHILSPFYPLK